MDDYVLRFTLYVMQLNDLLAAPNQQALLAQIAPTVDRSLVAEWQAAAAQREREDPRVGLQIAELLHHAAQLWQDEMTTTAARHVEANARLLLGEHQAAVALFEDAAARYRGLNRPNLAAQVAVGQIAALQFLGRFDDAATLAESALPLAEDALTRAKILLNSGIIAARQSRFELARERCLAAIDAFAAIDAAQYVAIAQINAANVLTERNDFRQAQQLFNAARAYCDEAGQASVVAQIDLNLAYLLGGQGAYQAALIHTGRARAIFAEQGNAHELAQVDMHRSDFYLALNLWQEALNQVKAALPYYEREGMRWEIGRLRLNEAAALAHSDQQAAVSDALDQAQAIFSAENNPVWQATTDLYRATFAGTTDRLPDALAVFRAAKLPNRIAQCLILLGNAAADVAVSERYFNEALSLTDQRLPLLSYACRDGLGQVAEKRAALQDARVWYRAAIEDIETLHGGIGAEDYKLAFLSDKLAVYERLVRLCLQIDTEDSRVEAFETVERARARALVDQLARTDAQTQPQDEMTALRQELNWLYNRLNTPSADNNTRRVSAELSDAIALREQQLLDHYQQQRDRISAPRQRSTTVTLAQLQAMLPPDTMVIEQFVIGGMVAVFGISAETLWVRQLPFDDPTVRSLLAQLRFQINKFNYRQRYRQRYAAVMQQSCEDVLQQLYDLVWRPIAEQMTAQSVILVPHGMLHTLPFHALFDGERYVQDKHQISYVPSATVLQHTFAPTSATSQKALIVGVEDVLIPHALTEAQTIGAIVADSEVRLGAGATVDDCGAFQLLHLATHATFRADNPLFSALKLADRWLTVQEIYQLASAPPLVTLSACDTHQHQLATGDELVGLARGFFAAGSRTLVASAWMVDDEVTAMLMEHFYCALRDGNTVAAALRMAQLAIRETHPHPYFWAAFMVTGNPFLKIG